MRLRDGAKSKTGLRPIETINRPVCYGALDLRSVEYFVAVAEELHFGRAAERLHIAQPSLSQQIRRLESQLGVVLLDRNSRNVQLTDAGGALLREGRRTLSQAQHAIQATRAAGAPRLTVGFYGSAGSDLLPDVLRAFASAIRSLRSPSASCPWEHRRGPQRGRSTSRSRDCGRARPSSRSR